MSSSAQPGLHSQPEPDAPAGVDAATHKRSGTFDLTSILCWGYLLATLAILAVLRFAGDRWWPATLLAFSPRWMWAAPLPFLTLLLLLRRRGRLLRPIAVAAVVVFFGITDFRVPWRQAIGHGTSRQTLRLVTCNLHNWYSNPYVLNAFVNEANPDIILLQDYTREREPLLVQQPGWYRFPFDGMYIASRYPFGEFENLLPTDARAVAYARLGLPLGKAQCYSVDLPGGKIHLVNLHLASAHFPLALVRERQAFGPAFLTANSERRREESTTISRRLQAIGGPFIVGGDFNTSDDSVIFRQSWSWLRDAFSDAGFGFGTTYAKHYTWLRIDHVLSNGDWHCTDFRIGTDVGSGHRPILVVFER